MNSLSEKVYPLDDLMPLILESLELGNSVRFSPRGTSMLPMLRQGKDTVILSPLPERLEKFDLPLYRRDDGHYVLHRIVEAGETYTCMGDNQFVPEPGVRRDQMLAVVTAFCRGNRQISVMSPRYRLYCRIWHLTRGLRYGIYRAARWLWRQIK